MKTRICGDTITNGDGDTVTCLLPERHRDSREPMHTDGDERWPVDGPLERFDR